MNEKMYLYVVEVFVNEILEYQSVLRCKNNKDAEDAVIKEIDNYFLQETKSNKKINYIIHKFDESQKTNIIKNNFSQDTFYLKGDRDDLIFKFYNGKVTIEITNLGNKSIRCTYILNEYKSKELFNAMNKYYGNES